jgi:hypothetical protein
MNKYLYLMIADRTMSVGPEWRRQPFVKTEAIVELSRRLKDGSGCLNGLEIGEA